MKRKESNLIDKFREVDGLKKILIISGNLYVGGAEKVARDIALLADREKYTFDYLVYGDTVGAYEAPLEAVGCRIFHLPQPREGFFRHFRDLRKLMKAGGYYAVHGHTMFSSGWAMLAAKICGVPVRVCHSHSALANGSGFVKSVYEQIMRLLILTCSTDLVACGIKAGQRLYGRTAFEKRGKLILNGIDIPAFAYDPDKRESIRHALHAEDQWIIGHVGHLAGVKNQRFLLELMPLLLASNPRALLLLLGEGDDRPMLEEKIREMGLQDRVILTGNVTNVAEYLSAMDVFAFPSLYEGLPLSILEVQANGLPCVISDTVPEDVFLTDLIHPLSLSAPQEEWVDKICTLERNQPEGYNQVLRSSDYAVEKAMEKIYRIYEKADKND